MRSPRFMVALPPVIAFLSFNEFCAFRQQPWPRNSPLGGDRQSCGRALLDRRGAYSFVLYAASSLLDFASSLAPSFTRSGRGKLTLFVELKLGTDVFFYGGRPFLSLPFSRTNQYLPRFIPSSFPRKVQSRSSYVFLLGLWKLPWRSVLFELPLCFSPSSLLQKPLV